MTNQTLLIQNNALDHLFYLAIEGRLTAADVRCAALKCIGNLVRGHTRNLEMLSKKMIGEELDREVSLNAVLHVLLNTTDLSEWMAADHVIKCFCEGNPEGQVVLASTLSPAEESQTNGNKPHKNNKHLPFGRILLHALDINKEQKDIVASCRAARVLTYVLQGNQVCKEKVLEIISEVTSSPLSNPEYMLSACVKYISSAASLQARREERDHTGRLCFVALMLRLLVTWFAECPKVVASFLETGGHLLCVVELLVNKEFSTSHHVSSLAAVVLGECIVYNPCADGPQCASMVVDTISQRIGLSSYFEMWEKLQKDAYFLSAAVKAGLLNISADASMDGEQSSPVVAAHNNEEHFEADIQSMIKATYDKEFVTEVQKLQPIVKEKTLLLFSHPKSEVIIPSLVNRNEGEGDDSYIERLQTLLQKQAQEMQEIMVKNVALAEELVNRSGDKDLQGERSGIVGESQGFAASRIEIEATKQRIQAYQQRIEKMEQQQHEKEQEALYYKQLSEKHEADLKALSAAYNSLEQANFRLEDEVQNLKKGAHGTAVSAGLSISDLDAAREEGRQEGAKASEAELNDLLVCLGQEESKVERLRARLEELGEDVEALLQDIDEEQEREHDVSE
ncbi:hypothetical protein KP509_19G032000 [Ceratopteris richardii]|nr:hypothetical protein KP509_19G032000 [Ceratopteris richardii]